MPTWAEIERMARALHAAHFGYPCPREGAGSYRWHWFTRKAEELILADCPK